MRKISIDFIQSLLTILILTSQAPAGQFKGFISGDLTDPNNWSGFWLPEPNEFNIVFAQDRSDLEITKDITFRALSLFLNPALTTFDLNGNTLRADLFSSRSSDSAKTLVLRDGRLFGQLFISHAFVLRDLVFNGSSAASFTFETSDGLFDNVQAEITEWNRFSSNQNLTIINQSAVSAEYLGAVRLALTDASSLSTDRLEVREVHVDQGSRVESNETRARNATISGSATSVDFGFLDGDSRLSLSVIDGAEARMTPKEPTYVLPIHNITVDGPGSRLIIDHSPNETIHINYDFLDAEPFIKLTNGGFMETPGIVNLKGSPNFVISRLDIIDSTFKGSLISDESIIHLERGNIISPSLTMNRGVLSGNGTIDALGVNLTRTTVAPEGDLIFTGNLFSSARLEFDVLSDVDFDRILVRKNLIASQSVLVRLDSNFRASVGDAINFLQVDESFPLGPTLASNMSIVGLPAGYSVEKVLTPHSLGIRITAVPEASTFVLLAIAAIGLTVFSRMKRHLPIALVDTIHPVRHRSA